MRTYSTESTKKIDRKKSFQNHRRAWENDVENLKEIGAIHVFIVAGCSEHDKKPSGCPKSQGLFFTG